MIGRSPLPSRILAVLGAVLLLCLGVIIGAVTTRHPGDSLPSGRAPSAALGEEPLLDMLLEPPSPDDLPAFLGTQGRGFYLVRSTTQVHWKTPRVSISFAIPPGMFLDPGPYPRLVSREDGLNDAQCFHLAIDPLPRWFGNYREDPVAFHQAQGNAVEEGTIGGHPVWIVRATSKTISSGDGGINEVIFKDQQGHDGNLVVSVAPPIGMRFRSQLESPYCDQVSLEKIEDSFYQLLDSLRFH